MYNQDRSLGVDDVKGLAAADTKHLELLSQEDKAEHVFIIEKIVWKLQLENTKPFPLNLTRCKIPMDESFICSLIQNPINCP